MSFKSQVFQAAEFQMKLKLCHLSTLFYHYFAIIFLNKLAGWNINWRQTFSQKNWLQNLVKRCNFNGHHFSIAAQSFPSRRPPGRLATEGRLDLAYTIAIRSTPFLSFPAPSHPVLPLPASILFSLPPIYEVGGRQSRNTCEKTPAFLPAVRQLVLLCHGYCQRIMCFAGGGA